MPDPTFFAVTMALIGEMGFMTIGILGKRLRNRHAKTLSIMAIYGLTIPVWVAIAAVMAGKSAVVFTPLYVAVVIAWVAVCSVFSFGTTYLSKFQSLSDGTGYKFGATVLLALAADVVLFQSRFDLHRLVPIVLLFFGGTMLHASRAKTVSADLHMPLIRKLPAIIFLSGMEVATYTLFKYGAEIQPSSLFHNAVMQTVLLCIFFAAGARSLQENRKEGRIPGIYIAALCILILIAAVCDGFAMAGLPVVVFVMFGLIRMVFFAIHDIMTKELHLNWINGLSIALIMSGMAYGIILRGF